MSLTGKLNSTLKSNSTMNRRLRNLALSIGALTPLIFYPITGHASSVDLNFHNEAARMTYATYTGRDVIADGGILVVDKNNDSEQLFHLGINKVAKNIRFGVRAIYTSPGNTDLLAVGLGLDGRFYFSKHVYFNIGGYYAPEATSFLDSAGYTEFNTRLAFNITDPLDLYVGYRNIKVKIEGSENKIEFDDELHVGFKFYF